MVLRYRHGRLLFVPIRRLQDTGVAQLTSGSRHLWSKRTDEKMAYSCKGNEVFQLYFGDCMEALPSVPDGSVDMVMCDLPYGTTDCPWDTLIPFDKLWEQYNRVCKENAAVVLTAQPP